jgi:hypothetical protein
MTLVYPDPTSEGSGSDDAKEADDRSPSAAFVLSPFDGAPSSPSSSSSSSMALPELRGTAKHASCSM